MNKFFCWLTGGHRYEDKNLESAYNPYAGQSIMVNRCVKCGKIYTAAINTDAILQNDIERFIKVHAGYSKDLMELNCHFSHSARKRKDGADNE